MQTSGLLSVVNERVGDLPLVENYKELKTALVKDDRPIEEKQRDAQERLDSSGSGGQYGVTPVVYLGCCHVQVRCAVE